MTTSQTPNREEQALAEVGKTRVSPVAARLSIVLFLAIVYSISMVQAVKDRDETRKGPIRELASELFGARERQTQEGWLAAHHAVVDSIGRFENRLEEESWLRSLLLPKVQALLSGVLGLGNEQVYPGRPSWLFFRPDIDYVTGRGFLEADVLLQRRLAEASAVSSLQPNPVVAIRQFARDLDDRDIRLLVVPTPLKPMIEGEHFSARELGSAAAQQSTGNSLINNSSYPDFLLDLKGLAIEVLDLSSELLQAKHSTSDPTYLRTDTHWTPEAMEVVARRLGSWIESNISLDDSDHEVYGERVVEAENLGDIALMLNLPEDQRLFSRQKVSTRRVLTLERRPWRSDSKAQILLLGDSFANIYSDPRLGWGGGAGLAERLSFRLQRRLDKLALNAGGSHATRQALARELTADPGRLRGKKLVIYQFAMRELASGDWKEIELARPEP